MCIYHVFIPDLVNYSRLTSMMLIPHQSNRSYSKSGNKSDTQSTYNLPFGKSTKKGEKKSTSASDNSGEEDYSTTTKSKSAKVVLHLFVSCPFLSKMYLFVVHLYI